MRIEWMVITRNRTEILERLCNSELKMNFNFLHLNGNPIIL